jgi:hypothetical protein
MADESPFGTFLLGMDPASVPGDAAVVFMGTTTDKISDMKVIGFAMGDKFFQYDDDGKLFEVMPSQDDFKALELIQKLCGATDGLGLWADEGEPERCYGRCNLPAGHGGDEQMSWHRETRDGELWAEWRGPNPGVKCRICGADGREH